jgi:adenylyltransferase/sulfurtransferase
VVCRRGNDSQIAVEMLNKYFSSDSNNNVNLNCIKDLIGGLQEWSNKIDPDFPKY